MWENVFITTLSLGLDTPRAPKFTFYSLIGVCSVRGANCSLYKVDIISHIPINGVCSGRVQQKFRAANFPTANFLAAKIPRTVQNTP